MKELDKKELYQAEFDKLNALFADAEEKKRSLASGLIEDAAYLYAENKILRESLEQTGMIVCNPNNPKQQRPVEAAKQYRQNVDKYTLVIGRLSKILDSTPPGDDDDLEEFE